MRINNKEEIIWITFIRGWDIGLFIIPLLLLLFLQVTSRSSFFCFYLIQIFRTNYKKQSKMNQETFINLSVIHNIIDRGLKQLIFSYKLLFTCWFIFYKKLYINIWQRKQLSYFLIINHLLVCYCALYKHTESIRGPSDLS